jgi:hypothetical protein
MDTPIIGRWYLFGDEPWEPWEYLGKIQGMHVLQSTMDTIAYSEVPPDLVPMPGEDA